MSSGIHTDRPIQLHWDGGSVVITPEDENRFVMESQRAVAACQSQLVFERYLDQFKSEFLTAIHRWCLEHADSVKAAYVPYPANQLQVFVVTTATRYDFSLSSSLSDLEMDLFEQSWPCEVLQLPDTTPESLQTFFDPDKSIQVYGNFSGTSGKSE